MSVHFDQGMEVRTMRAAAVAYPSVIPRPSEVLSGSVAISLIGTVDWRTALHKPDRPDITCNPAQYFAISAPSREVGLVE